MFICSFCFSQSDFCGNNIYDPYRNFENSKDLEQIKWYENETEKANELLEKIENKNQLFDKFISFYSEKEIKIYNVKITRNKEYFYLKDNGDGTPELYYRNKFEGKEEFLYSSKSYNYKLNRNYKINYIQPSWDSKKIAIGLSYDSKELSDVVIYDREKNKILSDVITNTRPNLFFGISWLPDNNSFTYLYFPHTDNKAYKKDAKTNLHILENNNDKVLISKKTNSDIIKNEDDTPTILIENFNSRYAISYIGGIDNYWDAYYTEIENLYKEHIEWKPLYKKSDKIYKSSGTLVDNTFFYKTAKKSSNFSIESFDLNNPLVKKELVEVKGEVIDNLIVTSKGILFNTTKNGIESKLYLKSNQLKEIELPKKAGNIFFDGKSKNGKIVYLTTEGWLNDYVDYYFNVDNLKFKERDIVPNIEYKEFNTIIVDEIEIPSYDGTLVPLTILYDKNIIKDGNNPTMITGYGAYGRLYRPYYSALFLNFVAEGGVVAIAHVRGGGEKGEAWHEGGKKKTKPNTWKDLIACTEYLIDEKYTSPNHIAIRSGSAGGIMVGRAMTERPDLFKAVVSESGQMNPFRSEFRDGGDGGNNKEYGSVKNEEECEALIEMDPYLNIQDKGVNYPATLLTAGENDPRIPMWIPGKFAMRLKESDTKNPVLFKVNYKSGHYGSDNVEEKIKQWANIYSFILWQTGHPDYQLKNNEQLEINN